MVDVLDFLLLIILTELLGVSWVKRIDWTIETATEEKVRTDIVSHI